MLRPLFWLRSSSCLAQSQLTVAAASSCSPTSSFAQNGSQQLDNKTSLDALSNTSGLCITSIHEKWEREPAHGGKQPQQQQSHIQQLQLASTASNSLSQYLQQQLPLRGRQCSAASLHSLAAGALGSRPRKSRCCAASCHANSAAKSAQQVQVARTSRNV
jgi:hypothetical protein